MLQIIPVLRVGGLERVATTLCIELVERVERIAVASMGGDPFEPMLVAAGVPVIRVPRPRANARRLVTSSLGIARAIRQERPQVIHAHNPAAAITAAIARVLAGRPRLPIVTTYHGVMPDRVGRAARTMEAVSTLVVGVGPTSTAALVHGGLDASRARTVHNAVEPVREREPADVRAELDATDAELVVSVGRYAPEKNQVLLLEAAAKLTASHPRLRVLLVGDGWEHDEESVATRLAELGLEGVATMTGQRTDAVDIIAAADVFALSSDSEGLPLVLLEAMTVGTPIVSTAAGGVVDVIEDGETGLLVPIRDAERLAEALDRMLTDAALRERLAENGRAFVARAASPRAMADAYAELYLEAVSPRRRDTA